MTHVGSPESGLPASVTYTPKEINQTMSAKLAPRPLVITQTQVDEYARLNSLCSSLAKDRDALRKDIVTKLQAGAECPLGGPWVVVLNVQERCANEWKDICSQIVAILPDILKQRATELITLLQNQKKSVPVLNVLVNPTWGDSK